MEVKYTGSVEACCPITLVPFRELRTPVAFRDTPNYAYECDDLLEWLQTRPINPVTNLEIWWYLSPLEVIGPVAGMTHEPGLVESTIVLRLGGDAMPLMNVLSSHWFWLHVLALLLAATNLITSLQSLFYVNCAAIVFAVVHWYWNECSSRAKKLSFLTIISVLFIGK
jgi:hypothetical protein